MKSISLLLLFAGSASAQTICKDSAGFVRMQGRDTIDVEKLLFMRDSVTGFQASKAGVVAYSAYFSESLIVTEGHTAVWIAPRPMADPPSQEGAYRVLHDTTFFGVRAPDRPSQLQQRAYEPGTAFLLTAMNGLEELIVRRAVAAKRADLTVPTYYPGRSARGSASLHFIGDDSLVISYNTGLRADLKIDAVGRVLRGTYRQMVNVSGTTVTLGDDPNPLHVERVNCGVVEPLLKRMSK